MKTKRLSARQARANFSDVLGSVYYRNEPVVIEKNGKPVAVVISPQMFTVIERAVRRGWEVIGELQARNADNDPDEVWGDVTAAVEDVRADARRKVAAAEGVA